MTDDTKEVWRVEIRLKFARSFRLKTSNVSKCLLKFYLLTLGKKVLWVENVAKEIIAAFSFAILPFFGKLSSTKNAENRCCNQNF